MGTSPPPSLFPPTRPAQDARRPHPINKMAPYPRHEDRRGRGVGHTAPRLPPYTRSNVHGFTEDPPTRILLHERPMGGHQYLTRCRKEDGTLTSPITMDTPHHPGPELSRTPDTTGMICFLTIEHINAQSLQANYDEVKFLVSERNINILCVSEPWLLPHTPDEYVNIHNYGRGAGACIYVNDSLNPIPVALNNPK